MRRTEAAVIVASLIAYAMRQRTSGCSKDRARRSKIMAIFRSIAATVNSVIGTFYPRDFIQTASASG